MLKSSIRGLGAVACVTVLGLLAAACGTSSASSSGTSSSSSSSNSSSSSAVKDAQANVAKLSGNQEFTVEPLSAKPPQGKVIAQVNCTIPQCSAGALDEPANVLGWKVQRFDFDLNKGAQDYLRAVNAALASKPDYLELNMNFGQDLIARQLATAKSEGIPVIGEGGGIGGDTVAAMIQNSDSIKAGGKVTGDVALADAGKSVNVALPIDPTLQFSKDFMNGVKESLAADPGSKVDTINLSFAQPAATNVNGIVNYLKSHPNTDYLLFIGTAFYGGLHQALEAAGLTKKVKLVLDGPYPGADTQAIKNGEFFSAVAGEHLYQWRMVDSMARLATSAAVTKNPIPPFRILTPANVTEEAYDPPNFKEVYKRAWGF